MVHESVYDEYVERAVERAKKRTVGNPFEDHVEQGRTNDLVMTRNCYYV